jgi:hypothetical protein
MEDERQNYRPKMEEKVLKVSLLADSKAGRKLIKNEVNKMEAKEFIEKMLIRFDCIKKIQSYGLGHFLIIFKPDKVPDGRQDLESALKEYGCVANFEVHQLKNTEVLHKILYSDDFEKTLLELMDFKYQKSYKINMTHCELDIDIFDIKIDSQLYKALKKKGLRFSLDGKNTLNIKR